MEIGLKCYFLLFLILFTNVYQKTFNFVNTDKPCRKKAKACEKTFTSYVVRSKKFVDYESTNKCQLYNFSKKGVLIKTCNFIKQTRSIVQLLFYLSF